MFRNLYSFVTPSSSSSSSSSSSMLLSLSPLRYFSIDSAHIPHSFTVSYLTNTCALSSKSALSVCKTVRFESSDQPDSVISCFQKYGFSKSNISQMITKFPKFLSSNPDKTISPKLEFFRSRGVSTSDLVKILTVNPRILGKSLENTLVLSFNTLIKMFQSERKAIEVIKHNPFSLNRSPEAALIPNVNALRENGVPESNILWLLHNYYLSILLNPIKFKKAVDEVKEMGFNPLKFQFCVAIMTLTTVSKSKRDGRVEVYKNWGWSDKDITTAFKKYPRCMTISDDNIMGTMDFFVNKLGLGSSVIANCPLLLGYSLKKRLIPRGAVIEYLSSKGLLKLGSKISTMFVCTESSFMEKYVKCHKEAPHLIELYNQKLNLSDTGDSGEDEE